MMAAHFDALETRSPAAREVALMARLPAQIAHAKACSPYYARSLAEVDAAAVTTREALAQLPVLRKHQLLELQKRAPPFGGLTATPPAGLRQRRLRADRLRERGPRRPDPRGGTDPRNPPSGQRRSGCAGRSRGGG